MKDINTAINSTTEKHPSNIEAEQALLGSILVNNDIIDEISSIIDAATFYDPAHVKIYEVIETGKNETVTTISIVDFEFNLPLDANLFVFDKEKYKDYYMNILD